MEVVIPIGYSFFYRTNYNNATLQKLLTIKRKTILYRNDKWKIYEDKYDKNWHVIFAAMKEAQVIHLDLDSNHFPDIVGSLQKIDFSRLISLNLANNNIENIERLHELNMPEIKQIFLANNFITSVRSFRKNVYPKLEYLDLSSNRIGELSYLNQFNNAKFSKLLLEWNDSNAIGRSINWLAKMNSLSFRYVRVESQSRIREQRQDRMINNRYPDIQIWRKANAKQQQ